MMKAVYDMARKGARDEIRAQMRDGGLFSEVDDENLPLESETRDGCDIGSFRQEVRFGDGYSQRAPAGLNADLKTYSVTLSVSREEATALESFLAEHGAGRPFCGRRLMVTGR